MPDGEEDVTLALKDSKIKLFGIVTNDDKVFLNLMQDMKKDIPNLEIKVIDECDHWMIVENPKAVDKALAEFLDTLRTSCTATPITISHIVHLLFYAHIVYAIYTVMMYLYISDIQYRYTMRGFRHDNACCDMRGMLGFLILFLLSKRPMHGQELADEIARRRGERPSPGTIYPALKNLRQAGFIREENKDGKTIVYSLTPRGEGALKIAKRRFTRTFLGVFP